MRVGMLSDLPSIFFQFILSFRNKIVEIELLYHVCLEKVDGTQLGDVGPVRELGCHIEIRSKFS